MHPANALHHRQYLAASILVLVVLLVSAIPISAAGIPQPPTVGPKGTPPNVQIKASVTTPPAFFGYNLGEDYKLTPWLSRDVPGQGARRGVVDYAYELQRTSNRVHIVEFGKSTLGRPMIYMVITAPDNWARIKQLKAINAKLADPRQIASDADAQSLAQQGKLVYWISGNIHSTERTSAEMFPRLAYKLAAFEDDWTKMLLDNVIVIIEPSSNPDGFEMVTDWYYKYLGTPYTNSSPPCYNNYMCHDNNRDFFGLQQVESRNIADARDEWKVQQYLDIHQAQTMLYQSPSLDPPNTAIDGLARAEWLAYGANNVTKMTALDWHGVFLWNYPDVFYPGYNESWSNMHNGLGTYWEVRGASLATPTRITSAGYPLAWYNPYPIVPPIDWHLMDAVNLEEDAVLENLDYSMWNKTPLLFNFYLKGKRNMAEAMAAAPYGYVIPATSGDNADVTDLVNNLLANKIEVQQATAAFNIGDQQFKAGDFIVRFDQPYGLSAKNYLGIQAWPSSAGTPYDVTAWTYQYLRDVAAVPVNVPWPNLPVVPLTQPVPYTGSLTGGASQWYVIEHQSNNNLIRALPQMWAKGTIKVAQTDAPAVADGMTYPAGTFFVTTSGSTDDHVWLKALVERMGLTARSLAAKVDAPALKQPRVGLYQPYSSPMNEGWLRLRLDDLKFPYKTLYNADIATPAAPLRDAFDVIILPSNSPNSIKNGSTSSSTPPEYRGGITQAGVDNLKAFVQAGGILALNGNSSTFPITFGWFGSVVQPAAAVASMAAAETLPDSLKAAADMMTNDTDNVPDRGLWSPEVAAAAAAPYAPGSILAVKVDATTPVGYGYDLDEAIWAQNYPFFSVTDASARAVATYPADRDALLSGYLTGGDGLRGQAAIVDATLGAGHVVMFGTDVTYRGQSTRDFMFLFNAILMGGR